MITVDQQMWTTLAGLASLVLVLLGYLGAMKRDLIAAIGKVEYRLDTKIDGARTELKTDIAALDTKIDGARTELKTDIAALDTKIDGARTELKTDIAALDTKIDGARTELKTDIAALDTKTDGMRTELRNEIAASHIDLKTDIGKVEDRLTAIESRTYDISTRLPPAPASTSR
jgi:chromosome segregation ATPase